VAERSARGGLDASPRALPGVTRPRSK